MIRFSNGTLATARKCSNCRTLQEAGATIVTISDGDRWLDATCSRDCADELVREWRRDAAHDDALGTGDSPSIEEPWWAHR